MPAKKKAPEKKPPVKKKTKNVVPFVLSKVSAKYIASLPWGTRSRFVNGLIEKVVEKEAARGAKQR